jgi:hypothetical protein
MMYSRTIIALLFIVLFSVIINSMEAYRFDEENTYMNHPNQNNDLNDPYIIPRLQALLAAAGTAYGGSSNKDSPSPDHVVNTRFAINRRPGLIRLKKNA